MKAFSALAASLSLVVFPACTGVPEFLASFGGQLQLIIPENAMLSTVFEVAAKAAGSTAIQWRVKDETGLVIYPFPCTSDQGESQSCIFDMAGAKRFEVTAFFPNGSTVTETRTVDIIDPSGAQNQAPKIVLDFKPTGSSTVVATVATFRAWETGATVFPEEVTYTLDFSRTFDDTTLTSQLKFELSLNDAAYETLGMTSSRSFSNPGVIPAKIRVTDLDGNYSIKTFTIFVTCVAPPLVVDVDQVEISPDAEFGFFTYDASGAVSGGQAPYRYRWDYNGDGIWDRYDPSTPPNVEDWTTAASHSSFTIYGGDRKPRLSVLDACNQLQIVEVPTYFAIPHTEGTNRNTIPDADPGNAQGPQLNNYHFLHANLSPLGGNTDPAIVDADLVSIQPPGDIEDKRVVCSATEKDNGRVDLTVHAKHRYDRKNVFYHREHGMTLVVTDATNATGNRRIHSFTVETDDGPDGQEFTSYSVPNGTPCNLTRMEVQILPGGAGTCSDGTAIGKRTYIFDYTFDCPLLREFRNQREARATHGSGFCEVTKIDQCPPGGGGGGGGLPPTPE